MTKRLFHFSDNPNIEAFEPRPVQVPTTRSRGMEWLNGPLVWAIDGDHALLYLFPRECPRIVMWRRSRSSAEDVARFLDPMARMTAYVERGWLARIGAARLTRYEMPAERFTDLRDAGMHVARDCIVPLARRELSDLIGQLIAERTSLRSLDNLTPLRAAWSSSLHVSGIRLRNAVRWDHTP